MIAVFIRMIMIMIIIVTGSQMRTREDMRRPDAIKPSPPSPPP